MKREEYQELVYRELDGDLTPAEADRLRAVLAADPEAKKFHEDCRSMFSMLSAVPRREPSPGLKKSILNSIATPDPASRHTIVHTIKSLFTFSHSQEVVMKNKLIIGGALAAIAVLYFAVLYPWPSDSEIFGTIGGAKKYRSEQITDKDVVVGGQENSTTEAAAGSTDNTGLFRSADIDRLAQYARTAQAQRFAELTRSQVVQKLAEYARSQDYYKLAEIARTAETYRLAGLTEAARSAGLAEVTRSAGLTEVQKFAEVSRSVTVERMAEYARTQDYAKLAGLVEVARTIQVSKTAPMSEVARAQELSKLAPLAEIARTQEYSKLAPLAEIARTAEAQKFAELSRSAEIKKLAELTKTMEISSISGNRNQRTGISPGRVFRGGARAPGSICS